MNRSEHDSASVKRKVRTGSRSKGRTRASAQVEEVWEGSVTMSQRGPVKPEEEWEYERATQQYRSVSSQLAIAFNRKA